MVAVALVDGRIRGQAVKVSPALYVINPHPVRPLYHDVKRMVVMRAILVLKFYIVMSAKSTLAYSHKIPLDNDAFVYLRVLCG
jgi:hypothetical protein